MARRIKVPKSFRNRSRESLLLGDSLPKSRNFWHFGAAFPPPVGLRWNFAQPSGTACPSALPSYQNVNRCNDSPLRGEKPDFWPASKFDTGRLPLRGNHAGKNYYNRTLIGEAIVEDVVTWIFWDTVTSFALLECEYMMR